jgi:site-specific recombinase XerD
MKGLMKRGTVWYIRYSFQGKDKWEAIGPSKRQAELVLAKRKVDIREGKYFPTSKGLKWTYGQLLDRYLEYAKVAKKASTYETDTYWAKHLRQAFGNLSLKDVTPDKVATYLENKLADGMKPATVAHHLALLKHSFTMAVKWELLPTNPLRDVRLPVKVNNARLRYLSPEEITRLLAACPAHLRPIVLTGLHTGMRKSEILTLRWEQVNLDQRFVLLTDTKNGDKRGVPLNTTMLNPLRDLQAEQERSGLSSPWVFPNLLTGQPYRRDANTAWRTARKKAGIANLHFHDTRHTTASHLRIQGADLLTIQEILGHKDLRMTTRYAHVAPTHRLAAIEKLEGAYRRQEKTDTSALPDPREESED